MNRRPRVEILIRTVEGATGCEEASTAMQWLLSHLLLTYFVSN